jgi:hypothetical protein
MLSSGGEGGGLPPAGEVDRLAEDAGGLLWGVEALEFSAAMKSSRHCAFRWNARASPYPMSVIAR